MVHTEKWIPAPGDKKGEAWRRWKDMKNRSEKHRKAKKRAAEQRDWTDTGKKHPGPDAGKKQRIARPAVQTTTKKTTDTGVGNGQQATSDAVPATAGGVQAVPAAVPVSSSSRRTAVPVGTVPAIPATESHDERMRIMGEYMAKASGLEKPQDPDVKVMTSCTCGPDVLIKSCSFCMYQISHEIFRHLPFEAPTPPGPVDGDLILSVSKRALQEYVAQSCLKYWNSRMRREQQHHQDGGSTKS